MLNEENTKLKCEMVSLQNLYEIESLQEKMREQQEQTRNLLHINDDNTSSSEDSSGSNYSDDDNEKNCNKYCYDKGPISTKIIQIGYDI